MKHIFKCSECGCQTLDRHSNMKHLPHTEGFYFCHSCGKKLQPDNPDITFIHNSSGPAMYNEHGVCISGYEKFLHIDTREAFVLLAVAQNKRGWAAGGRVKLKGTGGGRPIRWDAVSSRTKEEAEQQEIKHVIEYMQLHNAPEWLLKMLHDKLKSYIPEVQTSLF